MTPRPGAAVALSLFCLLSTAPRAMASGADRSSARATFLRFLPGGRDALPHLLVSLGGDRFPAVMDTGSTGLVVSADRIPAAGALPVLGPGRLTYSSSGRIMIGDWVLASVALAGSDDRTVTTAPMPVLSVRQERCLPRARRCTPSDRPRGIAMLGVGFAREGDHQPQGTPDRNPFLSVLGAGRPGYVVTAEGVHVGLTPGSMRGGPFVTVRLSRDAAGTDWQAPPVCITVDDGPPTCGSVLVDTGVTGMFLTVPPASLPSGGSLPDGSRLRLDLGGPARPGVPALSYDVVLGAPDDPLSPSRVTLVGVGRRATFVNTGVHFLRCFDLMFDADAGLVGYRRHVEGRT